MKDPGFAKFVVLVNGSVPLAILAWDAYQGNLGANPTNHALRITGMVTLIFLTLTLAITPVRKLTGWNWLSHFRRMVGLFAFFYALVHFSIYFMQREYSLRGVVQDTIKRKFIFFGITALLIMIPLAATSTNGIIKAMGAKKWKRLHQLVYVVGISAVVHYWLFGKVLEIEQKVFAVLIGGLLVARLVFWMIAQSKKERTVVLSG